MKFAQNLSEFASSKTNWSGLTMVVMSVLSYVTGTIGVEAMVAGVMNGLGMIGIKDAVVKIGKQ